MFKELARDPAVEQSNLDQAWLERLYAILGLLGGRVWLLGVLLGIAVMVVVGNTIRLDIENRREEIRVQKFIGATDAFDHAAFFVHRGCSMGC